MKCDGLEAAIEKALLYSLGEEGARPNTSHPKVDRAQQALEELRKFLRFHEDEFADVYAAHYDEPLTFKSRDFWERHLF